MTCQASITVDTTIAFVLPSSWSLVPSAVLCVLRCALNVAPHYFVFKLMDEQFRANTDRSRTNAGVLRLVRGFPANSSTSAALDSTPMKWIGVVVWAIAVLHTSNDEVVTSLPRSPHLPAFRSHRTITGIGLPALLSHLFANPSIAAQSLE